jgi:ATP sulfurylase
MTSESLIIPTDWRDNPSHARILTIAHRDFAFCAACQELIPVDMSKKQKRKHEHFKNFDLQRFDRATYSRTATIPMTEVHRSRKRAAESQLAKQVEVEEGEILEGGEIVID